MNRNGALRTLVLALATVASIAHAKTVIVGTNPLPTTAPAPDVVVRESFGFGPDYVRPTGGKGDLKPVFANQPLQGFWVEWPGSKNMAWLTTDTTAGGWRFCGASDNWNETLYTPLQTTGNGCVNSDWRDETIRTSDLLLPFAGLPSKYQISADLYPAILPGSYLALGLTTGAALDANLQTTGQIVIVLRNLHTGPVYDATWEIRNGGVFGELLASGTFMNYTFWQTFSFTYDPLTGDLSADMLGTPVGPINVGAGITPRYVAIEGQGIADNFIIRYVP